jgi:hypothetical protein
MIILVQLLEINEIRAVYVEKSATVSTSAA